LKLLLVSALAAGATGAVIASASGKPAKGGLSIAPALIERTAAVGAGDTVTVTNRSSAKLSVTVAARPWSQAGDGTVRPKRGATMGGIALSATAFTLAPGDKQQVTVSAKSANPQYGALEVIGLPPGAATSKGIVVGYRLVGSLRLDPATPVLKLRTAAVKRAGSVLALPVTNAGNTLTPVSGTARIKGALGTRNTSLKSTRILPGRTVNLGIVGAKGLPAGSYTATIVLKQGKQRTTIKRGVRVKR
jgi:hypothetical protein